MKIFINENGGTGKKTGTEKCSFACINGKNDLAVPLDHHATVNGSHCRK